MILYMFILLFAHLLKLKHFDVIKCYSDLGEEYTFTTFSELLISDGTMH